MVPWSHLSPSLEQEPFARSLAAFAQIFGFYGEPAVEDQYLWPFCMSIDKRMGQVDDLVLLLCVRIYLTTICGNSPMSSSPKRTKCPIFEI